MRTNNIYISDLLCVPAPKKTCSQEAYLRKTCIRNILWSLLPYVGQAILAVAAFGVTMAGILTLALGLGG